MLGFLLAATILSPGDALPELKGQYLTGRTAVLPQAAKGKVAFLALGFTYQSRFAVEAWTKRFRAEFGQDARVAFYEVPMIGGLGRMGKWFIDSGMKKATPKEDHERVITVYGGVDPWKQRLAFQGPDDAYLVLVDRDGVVRWLGQGQFGEAKWNELAAIVRKQL